MSVTYKVRGAHFITEATCNSSNLPEPYRDKHGSSQVRSAFLSHAEVGGSNLIGDALVYVGVEAGVR